MRRFALLLLLCLSACASGWPQTPQTGLYQFGAFDSPGFDTINRGNLNVHLSIPIYSKPGRAGTNFGLSLNYDSLVWTPSSSSGTNTWAPAADWGWTTVSNAEFGYVVYSSVMSTCDPNGHGRSGSGTEFVYDNFRYYDQDKRVHSFGYVGDTGCNNANGNGFTGSGTYTVTDNSGYTIYRNGAIFYAVDKSGSQRYVQAVREYRGDPVQVPNVSGNYIDTNGNTISASSSGVFTDTLGKTALSVTGSGTASSPFTYTYTDTTGTSRNVVVNYTNYNITTNFRSGSIVEYSGTAIPLISSIVYPDNSQYVFTYEPTPGNASTITGRLASITLRTGGKISYVYTGGSGGIEPDGSTAGLQRTTGDGTTSYVRSGVTTTASTTTYTDASSPANTAVSTFLADGSGFTYETSRSTYNGAAQGTPVQQVTTCYSSCSANSVAAPIQTISTTTALNGTTVRTDTQQYSGGQITNDNDGIVSETTAYQSFTGPYSIPFSRVASVTDAVGSTQIAKTTYSYDQTTPTTTSGIPQHAAVTTSRGNLTTIGRWLNTTGATLNTVIAYDDTGEPLSTTDAKGNVTTYGYDGATDSFLTNVTYPTPSSGVAIKTSATYDPNTGLPLTVTDANNQVTTYKSYDEMLRPTEVDFPDGGQTLYTYPSATQTTAASLRTSGNYITSVANADGYARQSQVTLDDPEGNDSVNYSYDANGRLHSVSNPYRGSPSATTTYSYDALGRKTAQGQPDGSTQSWSYSGNTMAFTNESHAVWSWTVDARGRMTKALEPAGAGQSSSPETDYTYNTNGGFTTTVYQQGVAGETARIRSFVSDSLGRTVVATTPEAGTICYGTWSGGSVNSGACQNGYDANGNLLAKTDAANTTVSYAYDTLNRLTGKTATNLNYSYQYDTLSGFTLNNAKGRLVKALNNGSADEIFSYDPMGRIVQQFDATPGNSNNSLTTTAVYDLAGNMTSLTYPDQRIVTQTWDNAAHLTSELYSSYGGNTINYPYLSSATYFPSGSPQTMVFGNGATQTLSLNNRLQPTEISLQASYKGLTPKVLDKQFCYGPAAANCSAQGAGVDNGNILSMPDALQSGTTQTFGYDNLNRLTSFGTGNQSMSQSFAYDSFGNMNQNGGTQQTNLSFNAKNQINSTSYTYDAAGRLTQFNPPTGGTQILTYDAEGKMATANNGAGIYYYTYDALNNRVRKDLPGGVCTEYMYFGGQPITEYGCDGTRTDYIYANGQRIARADSFDRRIWTTGTTVTTGHDATWSFTFSGYTVQNGDKISWRQYQDGVARGGVGLFFTDGTNTNTTTTDTDGQLMHADTIENSWHLRTVDLSSFAGKTINRAEVVTDDETPVGQWDIYYGDIAIFSPNGTVTPLYERQGSVALSYYSNGGMSNTSAVVQTSNSAGDTVTPLTTTTFYHGDHLGSTRLATTAAGWPVSAETYYPFGLEQAVPADANHYKFTGYERDAESTLDHATFRQLSFTQGRWTAPDPYYGSYTWANPQSFNRYSYALNNPMRLIDRSGLDACDGNDPEVRRSIHAQDDPCSDGGGDGGGGGGGGGDPGDNGPGSGGDSGDGGGDPGDNGPGSGGDPCANSDSCVYSGPSTPLSGTFNFGFITVGQFISMMQQSGIQVSFLDTLLGLHPGLNLRGKQSNCSIHINLDPFAGRFGNPVTGTFHIDEYNPLTFEPPSGASPLDINGGGMQPMPNVVPHVTQDVIPDLEIKYGMGTWTGNQECPPS